MTTKEFQEKFGIIGKSKAIKDLVDIIMQVAQTDISILITGESGVGKEVFARAIHSSSKRASKNLVSVNCGAIPEGILESELFGHKKGAFTGASDDRKGYFEIADNGTLFLDELGEMPLTTQVKLLRVIETNEFMPLGSETVKKVNVRIITATNKDLQQEVDSKNFRNDLFFRLKAVTLNIPPLRKRPEDVVLLAKYFCENYAVKNNIPLLEITNEALNMLVNYFWPGNVRELKNIIESIIALNKSGIIDSDNVHPFLNEEIHEDNGRFLPIHLNRSPESLDREMILGALIEIKKDLMELKSIAHRTEMDNHSFSEQSSEIAEVQSLEEVEKQAIINALNFTKWNKRKAANLLKISDRTLHRKIKEYEI